MIPQKISIQISHVRGGTLNSPPRLGFLSSSLLCLLLFDISYCRLPKLTMPGRVPQRAI